MKDARVLQVKTSIKSIAKTKIDHGHAHQGRACSAGEDSIKSITKTKIDHLFYR